MTVSDKIRQLRKRAGLTQTELGERLGVKKNAVSKWECGRVEDIPSSKIKAMASLFDVPPSYLIDDEQAISAVSSIPPGFQPMPPMTAVPLVGQIACGDPITAEENLEGVVNVPEAWSATFVLTCHGDSMEPKIKNRDLVAIRRQPEVENGQIAAVRIENEATLKRVYCYPDRLLLQPENPTYEPIILVGEEMNTVVIEGLAVGLCRGL